MPYEPPIPTHPMSNEAIENSLLLFYQDTKGKVGEYFNVHWLFSTEATDQRNLHTLCHQAYRRWADGERFSGDVDSPIDGDPNLYAFFVVDGTDEILSITPVPITTEGVENLHDIYHNPEWNTDDDGTIMTYGLCYVKVRCSDPLLCDLVESLHNDFSSYYIFLHQFLFAYDYKDGENELTFTSLPGRIFDLSVEGTTLTLRLDGKLISDYDLTFDPSEYILSTVIVLPDTLDR